MKILHMVTSMFASGGGTSEAVPCMCKALVEAGHEVRIVTGGGQMVSEAAINAEKAGVDVRYTRMIRIPHLNFLRVSGEFRQEIDSGVKWADIVHIHGLWQNTVWYTPKIARKYRKPYVMQTHGFLEPERLRKSAIRKHIVGHIFERPNLDSAAAIIATAESEKVSLLRYGMKSPIAIVPIGIDTGRIDAAQRNIRILSKWGLSPTKKTLLYLSRLTPIKGLDLLAVAWNRLKTFHTEWQLFIAGPDDRGYAKEVRSLYKASIVNGSVVVSGPVYGEEKNILLKSVDAFVLPTRSENFSIAVQEALAAGLPVVCTKGAPWQMIADSGAGEWVDVSVDGIYGGLRSVLSMSEASRRKMGLAGINLIVQNFSWERIAKKLAGVYQNAIRDMR